MEILLSQFLNQEREQNKIGCTFYKISKRLVLLIEEIFASVFSNWETHSMHLTKEKRSVWKQDSKEDFSCLCFPSTISFTTILLGPQIFQFVCSFPKPKGLEMQKKFIGQFRNAHTYYPNYHSRMCRHNCFKWNSRKTHSARKDWFLQL